MSTDEDKRDDEEQERARDAKMRAAGYTKRDDGWWDPPAKGFPLPSVAEPPPKGRH